MAYIYTATVTEFDETDYCTYSHTVGVFTSVKQIEIELAAQGLSLNDMACDYDENGVLTIAFYKDLTIEGWIPNSLEDVTYM